MPKTKKKDAENPTVDIREQLYNDGLTGLVVSISTPVEMITRLNGILLDIDPCLFKPSSFIPEPNLPPDQFYERYLSQWLQRHPVLQKAEVRCSGSGLHVILWPERPIELRDENERLHWAARVQVIQASLPTDPQQPGLNAMTRKVGSINGKNGAEVALLKERQGVSVNELLDLTNEIVARPFKTVVKVLTGKDRVDPCPLCKEKILTAKDHVGKCYECDWLTLGDLMDTILQEKASAKEVNHAA